MCCCNLYVFSYFRVSKCWLRESGWRSGTNLPSVVVSCTLAAQSVVLCFSSGSSVCFMSQDNFPLHLSSMKHSWCVLLSVHSCVSVMQYVCNGVCVFAHGMCSALLTPKIR